MCLRYLTVSVRVLKLQYIGTPPTYSVNMFSNSNSVTARKYTIEHEWVEVQGKFGTVGISQYAQVR